MVFNFESHSQVWAVCNLRSPSHCGRQTAARGSMAPLVGVSDGSVTNGVSARPEYRFTPKHRCVGPAHSLKVLHETMPQWDQHRGGAPQRNLPQEGRDRRAAEWPVAAVACRFQCVHCS